jgi:biopolymer transport protein ExbD
MGRQVSRRRFRSLPRIRVLRRRNVHVDRGLAIPINSEPAALDRPGQRLAEIFKSRAGRIVFVRAEPDVEFRHVAQVVDIAKGAGVEKIGLLAPLPPASTSSAG